VASCQCCAVQRSTPVLSRTPDTGSSGEEEVHKREAAACAGNLAGRVRERFEAGFMCESERKDSWQAVV
jgi:hypothetical protein